MQKMTIEEVNNDALIGSVRSAMLLTMLIQMGIDLVAGILIHVLAGTLIEEAVAIGIWFLGAWMYLAIVGAMFFVWKLRATQSIQPPARTDLDAILQFDTAYDTVKVLIVRYFRRYTYSCCGLPAVMTFLVALTDVPNAITANRLDLLRWPIIFGLVAFVPLLAFFIYNLILLGKYEERLKKNSLFDSGTRRGRLPVAESETVKFEALPGAANNIVPTTDQTLDTILQNN